LVQTERAGLRCVAWYLPVWQVRQLFTALLTLEACSDLLWHPLQTNFLLMDDECCGVRPPLPL
jgi:hypothetical protein